VQPPQGFVADHTALSGFVNSTVTSVQFSITDIGSEWLPTKVKHQLHHHGRRQEIRSEIGVKLAPGLAKKKGLSVYGKKLKNKGKGT